MTVSSSCSLLLYLGDSCRVNEFGVVLEIFSKDPYNLLWICVVLLHIGLLRDQDVAISRDFELLSYWCVSLQDGEGGT